MVWQCGGVEGEEMKSVRIRTEGEITQTMHPYAQSLIANIPRILNQLDRNSTSATFGCFDREYWHYKTADFACARKQEGVLSLALVFMNKFENNPYFNSAMVKEWCEAGIACWMRMQNNDGSFNEWYPEEHSFVASAFSTYAITEAILVLRLPISEATRNAICAAGKFLQQHAEFRVQNQQAGAIMALHNCSLVTGEESFAVTAKQRLSELAKKQTREGWFDEYGGPDIGYLSVAIDYLGKYYAKTTDKQAVVMMKKAASFLAQVMHPDGSAGGVYTSRSTEYLIPSAFEHDLGNDALILAQFCRQGIQSGVLPSCTTLDDRYLLYNGYTYAQAELQAKLLPKKIVQLFKNTTYFSECGWFIRRTKHYFIIINLKKGGAFYFASPDNRVHDAGVFIAGSPVLSSSFVGSSTEHEFIPKNPELCAKITVRGNMQQSPEEVLSPLKNMLLRGTQLTIGKNQKVRHLLKEVFRDRLIASRKTKTSFAQNMLKGMFRRAPEKSEHPLGFERCFVFSEESVAVEDMLHNPPADCEFLVGAKQAVQTVPSSRFFVLGDLEYHVVSSTSATIHRKLL